MTSPNATPPGLDPNSADAFDQAHELLANAASVAVLTGAGISTDSGIPDFRGEEGVWTKNPDAELYSTIDVYLSNPEVRAAAWNHRATSTMWDAEPNAGHLACVALERQGRLHTLVTQNIDGLHLLAGNSPDQVVEIHGSIRGAMCVACDWTGPIEEVIGRVLAGEADPPCVQCGGILKSTTVLFGQTLPPGAMEAAAKAAFDSDVLLAVGTTLGVTPVNNMVRFASSSGRPVIILNGGPTEMDSLATAVIRGSISEVLPALLA